MPDSTVHDVDEKPARPAGGLRHGWEPGDDSITRLAVGGEVVLAAKPVVPNPARIWNARVKAHATE